MQLSFARDILSRLACAGWSEHIGLVNFAKCGRRFQENSVPDLLIDRGVIDQRSMAPFWVLRFLN